MWAIAQHPTRKQGAEKRSQPVSVLCREEAFCREKAFGRWSDLAPSTRILVVRSPCLMAAAVFSIPHLPTRGTLAAEGLDRSRNAAWNVLLAAR